MDKFTPDQRSKIMSAIHSRDTLPEIAVRKWLHAHGYRFRVCEKRIAEHPDVVLPRLKPRPQNLTEKTNPPRAARSSLADS